MLPRPPALPSVASSRSSADARRLEKQDAFIAEMDTYLQQWEREAELRSKRREDYETSRQSDFEGVTDPAELTRDDAKDFTNNALLP